MEEDIPRAGVGAADASDIVALARKQNLAEVTEVLEDFPQLWRATDPKGRSLLHLAALAGDTARYYIT